MSYLNSNSTRVCLNLHAGLSGLCTTMGTEKTNRHRLSSFHAAAYPAGTPSGGQARRLSSFHAAGVSPKGAGVTPAPQPRLSRAFGSGGCSGVKLRLSLGGTPHAGRTPRGPEKLSKEDVAQLYSETIKLSQDNKITTKNTWSLQLIDYMGMLVRGGDDETPSRTEAGGGPGADTNFQLAGVALDAGVRIYCSRVDSVHSNAFKVLGGLSRTAYTGGDDGEDGDDDGESQRTRRRPRGGSTLIANVSTVTVRKLDTDLAVDPLFQKMSEAFDEGSVQGMLANRLLVAPAGYIQFDSAEKASPPAAPAEDGVFDPGESNETYEMDGASLCPEFMSWVHAKKVAPESASPMATNAASMAASQVEFEYDADDAIAPDSNNVFIPAMDAMDDEPDDNDAGGGMDDIPEDPDAFEMAPFDAAARLSDEPRASPVGVDLVEAGVAMVADSEYTFFDAGSLAAWSGPTHWTYRQRSTKEKKPSEKRPRSKTAMLLDYSEDAPPLDFEAEFKRSRGANQVAQETGGERKTTLPIDFHYSTEDLRKLFILPGVRVAVGERAAGAGGEALAANDDIGGGGGWYDYDNDMDAENFVGEDFGSGGADDDDGPGPAIDNVDGAADVFGQGDDLVPLPDRVDKLGIGYATVAKKVDVRKLKTGLWSHLCGGVEGDMDVEEIDESPSQEPDKDIRTEGITQTLSGVVQEMPTYLLETERVDVTFPYVFICLLHLANEKSLRIEPVDGALTDLVIRRDGVE